MLTTFLLATAITLRWNISSHPLNSGSRWLMLDPPPGSWACVSPMIHHLGGFPLTNHSTYAKWLRNLVWQTASPPPLPSLRRLCYALPPMMKYVENGKKTQGGNSSVVYPASYQGSEH